jgi:hypothetical protein
MTYSAINIGTTPNDGTGDPIRTAFDKVNTGLISVDNQEYFNARMFTSNVIVSNVITHGDAVFSNSIIGGNTTVGNLIVPAGGKIYGVYAGTIAVGNLDDTTLGLAVPAAAGFTDVTIANLTVTANANVAQLYVTANTTVGNLNVTGQVIENMYFVGKTIYVDGSPVQTAAQAFTGGNISNPTRVLSTVDSTSPSSGALRSDGGLGVSLHAYIGQDLTVVHSINADALNATSNIVVGPSSNVALFGGNNAIKGTLISAAQPNVTSVGSLSGLSMGGNITAGLSNTYTIGEVSAPFIDIYGFRFNGTFLTGTLQTAAQTNITSVGSLLSLDVVGNIASANITTGNIRATGTITTVGNIASANITTGNINASGTITAGGSLLTIGNITSANETTGNITITGNITTTANVTGNVTSANVTTGNIQATGTITAGGTLLTTGNITSANLSTGNITITGNITTTANVTGNITSANVVTGNINATGTITAGGTLLTTGNITSANVSTGNITITGNITTTANVTGNVTSANVTTGNIQATGTITVPTLATTGNINTSTLANVITGNVFLLGNVISTSTYSNIAVANVNLTGMANIAGSIYGVGNGLVQPQQFFRLNATLARTDTTTQSIFGQAFTVLASTVYEFDIAFGITKSAGANGHTLGFVLGGTATQNNLGYIGYTSGIGMSYVSITSMVIATNPAASYSGTVWARGTVSINAGGTFTPTLTTTGTVGGAYSITAGSYMKLTPIGTAGANVRVGSGLVVAG